MDWQWAAGGGGLSDGQSSGIRGSHLGGPVMKHLAGGKESLRQLSWMNVEAAMSGAV